MTTETPDPRGQVLGDRWVIEERLGEGGMGQVFKIRALSDGRIMAAKLLHNSYDNPIHRARFEREGMLLSRLAHPYIVRMIEFAFDPEMGGFYLIMEHLSGVSLSSILEQRVPLACDDVLILARQMALALEEVHLHDIVHRDIKPTNINVLLDKRGRVHTRLFDFGIAKDEGMSIDALTAPGQRIGTIHYMSPEQAMGEPVDRRSDLYALGVLLYELLAGQPPYMGSLLHVLNAHTMAAVPDLRLRWNLKEPVVPKVVSLVHSLLNKKPQDRPQSASAVLEVLGAMSKIPRPEPDRASRPFRHGYREALRARHKVPESTEKTTEPD